MKFKEAFATPLSLSNGMYALSREHYTEKEAKEIIAEELGECSFSLEKSRARFSHAPDFVEDYQDLGGPCWWTGASGKGSKKIWVFNVTFD